MSGENWRYMICPDCRARTFGPDGTVCPFGHGQMRPVTSPAPARKVGGEPVPAKPARKRRARMTHGAAKAEPNGSA